MILNLIIVLVGFAVVMLTPLLVILYRLEKSEKNKRKQGAGNENKT